MAHQIPTRPVRGWRRAVRTAVFLLVLGLVLSVNVAVWQGGGSQPLRPRLGVDDAGATAAGVPPRVVGRGPSPEPTSTSIESVAPTPTPPLRAPRVEQPLEVWFSGDSTAYAIGESLRRIDSGGLLATELQLMTSSGLARPDFFDWPAYLQAVQAANPQEVMILSIGANDLQPLEDPGGTVHEDVLSSGWAQEYERRVDQITRAVTDLGTRLYWIGQPIARDPAYDTGIRRINEVLRSVADRYDAATFVDTYPLLAGDDLTYLDDLPGPDGQPITVRRTDGVHLTLEGGSIVAAALYDQLRRDWGG